MLKKEIDVTQLEKCIWRQKTLCSVSLFFWDQSTQDVIFCKKKIEIFVDILDYNIIFIFHKNVEIWIWW